MTPDTANVLAPEDTRRLIDFARAFKAAARAVVLYPPAHPAIAVTLGRMADLTSVASLATSWRITVLPDSVSLDGLVPGRSDALLTELAALLHSHLVGEVIIHPGGDVEAWRRFLLMVGRPPDDIRNEGGIAQLWTSMAGQHVELRQIDYAAVLSERGEAGSSSWSDIVAHCLSGERLTTDDEGRRFLIDAGGNPEMLERLVRTLDAEAVGAGSDLRGRAAALVRFLDRMATAVVETRPEQISATLDNFAATLAHLSPDMMLAVLSQPTSITESPGLVRTILSHISDRSMARYIAGHAMADGAATERLAQVFQTLVPEDGRDRLMALAKEEASSEVSDVNAFEERWEAVATTLLTSYSDKPFVSDQYGRELNRVRQTAIDVEQVSDDPIEIVTAWLGSVADTELRKLDLALVHDLLRIETDQDLWASLMRPVASLIDDLLLVGDFEAADGLVRALVAARTNSTTHGQAAAGAVEAIVAGSMMRHVTGHLAMADDAQFECVKGMLLALGEPALTAVADALIVENHPRTRERLTVILLSFGANGRRQVERLKSSSSAVVRRTAVSLLRQFGGSEALPELAGFLKDDDPQVHREAVHAILAVGTERAYMVLGRALTESTPARCDAIVAAINASREERCAPVFAYLLRHIDHRGPHADLYVRAIRALGALKDPEGITPLKEALHRGEWWAPRRTAILRSASAAALARIGTRDALGVLEQAVVSGSRGVRAVARAQLTTATDSRRAQDAR